MAIPRLLGSKRINEISRAFIDAASKRAGSGLTSITGYGLMESHTFRNVHKTGPNDNRKLFIEKRIGAKIPRPKTQQNVKTVVAFDMCDFCLQLLVIILLIISCRSVRLTIIALAY